MSSPVFVSEEDILWSYISAQSEISNAVCSMSDEEVSDRFIFNRLYSALCGLTEMILLVNGKSVPPKLADRVHMVDAIAGYKYVPMECRLLLSGSDCVDRDRLAGIAQVIDCWACMLGNKFSNYLRSIDSRSSVRALVG